MKILNLGSLNIDRVYNVHKFVAAGETISAEKFGIFLGGKGFNQSIAIARAGGEVYHAGAVGTDGEGLISLLEEEKVHLDYLRQVKGPSGHAVIQVDDTGQNSIIVYAGANGAVDQAYIDEVLGHFDQGDLLLLQNEVSNVGYAILKAHEKGMKVAFNPSPITPDLFKYPLGLVDFFILNELEGKALTGEKEYEAILDAMSAAYPNSVSVLTVGEDGVIYRDHRRQLECGIYKVSVMDTTAAGDTFCGYFLAGLSQGRSIEEILKNASMASAIAVSRKGASPSIPTFKEVNDFLGEWSKNQPHIPDIENSSFIQKTAVAQEENLLKKRKEGIL